MRLEAKGVKRSGISHPFVKGRENGKRKRLNRAGGEQQKDGQRLRRQSSFRRRSGRWPSRSSRASSSARSPLTSSTAFSRAVPPICVWSGPGGSRFQDETHS